MAQNSAKILLGFPDELINDKYKNQINFTINKIGGKPDLPPNIKFDYPKCPLCQLVTPLVVQIYAPLDDTHRTLYLFACINPNCWNQNQSWTCLRVQSNDALLERAESSGVTTKTEHTDWCTGADDWDDVGNANLNEPNGNVINNNEKVSDEDDESYSFEDSIIASLGNVSIDSQNANNGILGGAVGRLHSPSATAEIEGDEGEIVSIDTPTLPQRDIPALLNEVTPLPNELRNNIQCRTSNNLYFIPYFMNVWEETYSPFNNISDRHVKELLQEYQQHNDGDMNPISAENKDKGNENSLEKYEKSHPAHGDKMFHHFLSKIQMNPGQILRYNREGRPLIYIPIQEMPKKCAHCHGELVFEFQLLPTIISKLKLYQDPNNDPRLEFGNVLIFSCRKSCWSTDIDYRNEFVIVQSEIY